MTSRRQVGPVSVLLVALLVNLPLTHAWWTDRQLEHHGARTTATVHEARTVAGTDEGRRFLVAYRLPAAVDPEQRAFTGEVDPATYELARRTGRLEVTYLPGEPGRNRPVAEVASLRLAALLTALADLALLAILGLMLWARRTQSDLVLRATADVVRCRPQEALEDLGGGEYVVRGDVLDRGDDELTIAVGHRRVRVLLGNHVNPVGHQQPAEARGRELPPS